MQKFGKFSYCYATNHAIKSEDAPDRSTGVINCAEEHSDFNSKHLDAIGMFVSVASDMDVDDVNWKGISLERICRT